MQRRLAVIFFVGLLYGIAFSCYGARDKYSHIESPLVRAVAQNPTNEGAWKKLLKEMQYLHDGRVNVKFGTDFNNLLVQCVAILDPATLNIEPSDKHYTLLAGICARRIQLHNTPCVSAKNRKVNELCCERIKALDHALPRQPSESIPMTDNDENTIEWFNEYSTALALSEITTSDAQPTITAPERRARIIISPLPNPSPVPYLISLACVTVGTACAWLYLNKRNAQ